MYIDFFFFQAEDGIRDWSVTGVQTCALPICAGAESAAAAQGILWDFDLRPQSDDRCAKAPGLYRHGADDDGAASRAGLRAGQANKRRSQREHSGLAGGRDLQQPEREAAYLRVRDDRDL